MDLKKPSNKDIDRVYYVFKKNYIQVPLEVFGVNPYKTLISTLLSSRTKDETTLKASISLFKKAPDIHSLYLLNIPTIQNLIYPVGFYKTKAKQLKRLAKICIDKFNGQVPKNREDLMTFPGVGRKTANLVLNRAFGIPVIAVDTHVHKISNLLGWVNTKKPEQTELELTKILPKKYISVTNKLFVSIGRQYSTKRKLIEFLRSNNLIKNHS